jgi:metallophosphoesterase superfamily enzyme
VSDGRRVVLPAFGAYAGGLDLWEHAISSLFEGAFGAFVLGRERVYAVPGRGVFHVRRNASEDSQPSSIAISTVEMP